MDNIGDGAVKVVGYEAAVRNEGVRQVSREGVFENVGNYAERRKEQISKKTEQNEGLESMCKIKNIPGYH